MRLVHTLSRTWIAASLVVAGTMIAPVASPQSPQPSSTSSATVPTSGTAAPRAGAPTPIDLDTPPDLPGTGNPVTPPAPTSPATDVGTGRERPQSVSYGVFVKEKSAALVRLSGAVRQACRTRSAETKIASDPAKSKIADAATRDDILGRLVVKARASKEAALTDSLHEELFPPGYALDERNDVWKYLHARATGKKQLPKLPSSYLEEWMKLRATTDVARDELCRRYGPDHASILALPAFEDVALASAAVMSDMKSLVAIDRDVKALITAATAISPILRGDGDPLTGKDIDLEAAGFPYETLVNFSTELLQGLAKLVVERAKYETAAWMLERLGKDMCLPDDDEKPGLRAFKGEMSRYWAPRLCKRAESALLWEYGTSTATLQALRGDIEADVKSWPGHAVGLGLGTVLRTDAKGLCAGKDTAALCMGACPVCNPDRADTHACDVIDPLSCPGNPKTFTALGRAVDGVRNGTAKRLTAILEGRSAPLALSELGDDLAKANAATPATNKAPGKNRLFSDKIAVLACAATLPEVVATYREKLGELGSEESKTRTAALVGFVHAKACFDLVGKGKDLGACLANPADEAACADKLALDSGSLEKLSTLVRLDTSIGGSLRAVDKHAQALAGALKRYEEAAISAKSAIHNWKDVKPPTIDGSALGKGESAADVAQKYLDGVVSAYEIAALREYLTAAIDVGQASVGLADATLDGLLVATDLKGLVPGLCEGTKVDGTSPVCDDSHLTALPDSLKTVKAELQKLDDTLHLFRQIAANDWSHAVTDGLAMLQGQIEDKEDAQVIGRVGAVLIGILSAHDGDEMAVALDAAASPPGGWRRKQATRWALSVSAFPGIFFGGELRNGFYLKQENFNHTTFQMPALALPIGLDLAITPHRYATIGLFVPLIDPAGYLQYDADNDARLPGASLKTALCLGLGVRYAIPTTPFNAMFLGTYRPGFRQAEPDATGTGADAVQFGGLLSVDVTLLELVSGATRAR